MPFYLLWITDNIDYYDFRMLVFYCLKNIIKMKNETKINSRVAIK